MAEGLPTKERVQLTEKQVKAQRARNFAIAIALVVFVVILYFGTQANLGANVLKRPL